MNKQMIKKTVANKVVDLATKNIFGIPGSCTFLFGKPKERYKLTTDDYTELATFVKRSQS